MSKDDSKAAIAKALFSALSQADELVMALRGMGLNGEAESLARIVGAFSYNAKGYAGSLLVTVESGK